MSLETIQLLVTSNPSAASRLIVGNVLQVRIPSDGNPDSLYIAPVESFDRSPSRDRPFARGVFVGRVASHSRPKKHLPSDPRQEENVVDPVDHEGAEKKTEHPRSMLFDFASERIASARQVAMRTSGTNR